MVTAALVGWSSCPDLDMVGGPLPSLGSGSAPEHGWKLLVQNLADKNALEDLTSTDFLREVPPMIEALPQHLKDLLPALPAEGSSTWKHWAGGFSLVPLLDAAALAQLATGQVSSMRLGALESADARQSLAPCTLSIECVNQKHCKMFLDHLGHGCFYCTFTRSSLPEFSCV